MWEIINHYIIILFSMILMSLIVNFLNFKNKTLKLKQFLFFVAFIYLYGIIADILFESWQRIVITIIVLVLLIMHFYKFKFFESLVMTIYFYTIVIIADLIVTSVFLDLLGYNVEVFKGNFKILTLVHAIMFLIIFLFYVVIKIVIPKFVIKLLRLKNKFYRINNIKFYIFFLLYLFFSILIITLITYLYQNSRNYNEDNIVMLVTFSFAVFSVLNFVLFYIYQLYSNQVREIEQKEKEYEELMVYTNIIEGMYKNFRAYRHDFVNTLFAIKGFLDINSIDGLKDYFYKDILQEAEILNKNKEIYSVLNNLKHPALKGLVGAKIATAQEDGIDVSVTILDIVEKIDISPIHLSKVIGILLDNAIEAAKESQKKRVSFSVLKGEGVLTFKISNSFKEIPGLEEIFKEGFSTKKEHDGIGLYTVKSIISKYSNVLMNTFIKDDCFIQEVNISQNT